MSRITGRGGGVWCGVAHGMTRMILLLLQKSIGVPEESSSVDDNSITLFSTFSSTVVVVATSSSSSASTSSVPVVVLVLVLALFGNADGGGPRSTKDVSLALLLLVLVLVLIVVCVCVLQIFSIIFRMENFPFLLNSSS